MRTLQEMTLQEKLGQRLAAGFQGLEPPKEFLRLIKEYKVGNIILFRCNIQDGPQLKKLCATLRKVVEEETGVTPFITIDQEGGVVTRLPESEVNIPGAMAVAATGNPRNAYDMGLLTAQELRSCGVDFDLAPVMDINCNPDNPVIGVRSYGDTPERVAEYGSQMVRGLLLPAAFLTVLFYNVCQIAHVKTLDFGKLTGFIYFSGVITFCFYSLIHLKRMLPFAEYRYDAIYFILLILCFAWGGDTAAYFAGRAFGRHKLAPIVSPHKTVEGAVGGVLGSMAAGCVLTLVYSLLSAKYNVISIQVQPKHYLVLLGMGAVASVLGILGDLFASSVKRQVGIKDYGTIFPGHGGILDRFDSVMFIAPFVSIAVRYFFYLL